MRKHWKLISVILIILLATGYVAFALTRPIPKPTPKLAILRSQASDVVSPTWPHYGEAALGAVGYGILDTNGTQSPMPTASTIKILTALAVLSQHPLTPGEQGPTLTLTQADVDSYNKYVAEDGSVVRVVAGEQITEYQALQALLLPSANNMAETLARWAYGSIDAYNTAANQLAASLGMTNTTVTDPSGFLPTTEASAHDLVLLGEAALKNTALADIVGQTSAVIPVQGTIRNVNGLLGEDGIVGIKTGNNDQDKGVFLFGALHTFDQSHSITIVGAIMDGPDLGTAMYDALPVINSAKQNFELNTIVQKGEVVGHYDTPWMKPVDIIAKNDVSIITWQGKPVTTLVSLQKESAPLKTGTHVGTITIHNGSDNSTATSPAVLKADIPKPGLIWRLEHAF